jgi:hypothetical protein
VANNETGNGKDLVADRARLLRHLARLPPKDRLDALIDAPDSKELVEATPAEDLYATIAEIGLADSTELVQLASPEQFRAFVDLGGWSKDEFDLHRAVTWLRAARGEDRTSFMAKVRALDAEVLELIFRRATEIHDREQDPDFVPNRPSIETPDGKYLVELVVEGPELSTVRALLSELVVESPFEASRLLEAIRWELPSELEETAYRFRQARLDELGFPSLENALAIFTFADPGPSAVGPVVAGRQLAGPRVDLLDRALGEALEEEREQFEQQLRHLANSALVVEAADPGDLAAARRVAEMVRDYLSLGFEHACGNEPGQAAPVLRQMGLRRIFQIGFSLTLKLKFRADALTKHPLIQREGIDVLFEPEQANFAALRRKRPLRALSVEGAEAVPFRSKSELRAAEESLARAEQQVSFLFALLGDGASSPRDAFSTFGMPLAQLGIERLFAAVTCNALLEARAIAAPVNADRLSELMERLINPDSSGTPARPSAIEQVEAVLSDRVPVDARGELGRQIARALSRVAADLRPAVLQHRALAVQELANLPVRQGSGL